MTTRVGRLAAWAGVLMAAGVAGEWFLSPQQNDGSVTSTPVFAALVLTSTVGFALLLLAARGLRGLAPGSTRTVRLGAGTSVAGAGLLTLSGVVVLVTGVVGGRPLEASFIAFALGMLLLSVGSVVLGSGLRRRSPANGVWQLLVVSGLAAFAAVAIPLDPWHDVALMAMFAAWTTLGVLLMRAAAGARAPAGARAA